MEEELQTQIRPQSDDQARQVLGPPPTTTKQKLTWPGLVGPCLLVLGLVVFPAQPWILAPQRLGIGPFVHGFWGYLQALDKIALAVALVGLLAAVLVPLSLSLARRSQRSGVDRWLAAFAALSIFVYLLVTYRGNYLPQVFFDPQPIGLTALVLLAGAVLLLVQTFARPPIAAHVVAQGQGLRSVLPLPQPDGSAQCPYCRETIHPEAQLCRFCNSAFGASAPPAPGLVGTSETDAMAIISLVLGILGFCGVGSLLAIIFGYSSLRRIAASHGRSGGRGMAVAGIVLGWIGVVALLVVAVLWLVVWSAA